MRENIIIVFLFLSKDASLKVKKNTDINYLLNLYSIKFEYRLRKQNME